jgi:hypothetical protein
MRTLRRQVLLVLEKRCIETTVDSLNSYEELLLLAQSHLRGIDRCQDEAVIFVRACVRDATQINLAERPRRKLGWLIGCVRCPRFVS